MGPCVRRDDGGNRGGAGPPQQGPDASGVSRCGSAASGLDEPRATAYLPPVPPRISPVPPDDSAALPDHLNRWFAARGWAPRAHQLALLDKARAQRSALLIAPTGAGKTLAGFLPTLVELGSAVATPHRSALAKQAALSTPFPLVGEGRGGGPPAAAPMVESAPQQPASQQSATADTAAKQPARFIARPAGLHTLYISPLKALAVDIARNLQAPISEMGLPIKVETRTGDTPASRKQRQRRYPPDILLTTPEQLALLLSSDDAPHLFSSLQRVVLDELQCNAVARIIESPEWPRFP